MVNRVVHLNCFGQCNNGEWSHVVCFWNGMSYLVSWDVHPQLLHKPKTLLVLVYGTTFNSEDLKSLKRCWTILWARVTVFVRWLIERQHGSCKEDIGFCSLHVQRHCLYCPASFCFGMVLNPGLQCGAATRLQNGSCSCTGSATLRVQKARR